MCRGQWYGKEQGDMTGHHRVTPAPHRPLRQPLPALALALAENQVHYPGLSSSSSISPGGPVEAPEPWTHSFPHMPTWRHAPGQPRPRQEGP
eukprot:CAMPEP_0118972278 /NCGR_PEP_ID=MMETSP1173-20130426/8629_1 /TAXON_ID=1034831 /ORGANISM="Rhizochromulina marina cf, Strain CCMP1243" /LENGTH=91 /DNA_ID=CAMNT_0006921799 /DNA_START=437 /DNA_END=708 /DNA_ORIENTATION=-